MINGKSVLAIIPARGSSKRLPRKNILPLLGKPLVAWTIDAALSSSFIDRCIISTDDEEIAQIAREYGCDVPFIRPTELATDRALSNSVYLHALEALSDKYDIAIFLQPTSPLRKTVDIDQALELMQKKGASSIVSVVEAVRPLEWYVVIGEDFKLKNVVKESYNIVEKFNRPKTYYYNGAIKAITVNYFLEKKVSLSPNTIAYIMPLDRSVDIDNEFDFRIAEMICKNVSTN